VVSQSAQADPVGAAAPISGHLGRSMPSDLADTLRSRIHGGQLGPGDRLPNERDLAASLGVGRITVREAIRVLVDDGYLVSKRGNSGGTFVSDLAQPHRAWLERIRRDPHWIVDLIEYRKAVEMRAAELAASRRSAAQLTEMRRAIKEGSTPSSRSAFRQADHRFHLAVADASGSERLAQAIVRARGELFVPTDQLVFHDHYTQTKDEHTEILTAIKDRDPAAARAAAEAHLEASLRDFLDMCV
jgi:GntR family transcriptional regulator, transcriptional repressor for pyruvate dehydrogenase complex